LLLVSYCNFCLGYFKQVLDTWDDMVGVDHLEEDSDGKTRLKAWRSAGMSAFPGEGGMVYMEYKCRLAVFPFDFLPLRVISL
jgi:hypothetical protein